MNFTDLYILNENRFKNLKNKNFAPNIKDTKDNKVRTRLINFYKKYSNGVPESEKLNWQDSKNLINDDFDFLDKYISREPDEDGEYEFLQKNSKAKHSEIYKANKREIENRVSKTRAEDLFIDKPEENILFHIYPEISNEDWLFVSPLTYKAAVYMNSRECGLGGACWCIGNKNDDTSWINYTDYSKFLLAFNKKFKTLENIKIDGIPFNEAKDEIGNPVNPSTINKWGIKHGQGNDEYIRNGDICTYQDLFTKFMIQIGDIDSEEYISIWSQPDKQYEISDSGIGIIFDNTNNSDIFDVNFHITEDDLLNLDFSDFEEYNNNFYDKRLKSLRKKGFYIDNKIEKIIMPNNICHIYDKEFKDFSQLKDIELSENLLDIGDEAFSYCISLKNIYIPESINYISYSAFEGCDNLETIYIPEKLDNTGFVPINCKIIKYKEKPLKNNKSLNKDNIDKNFQESLFRTILEKSL